VSPNVRVAKRGDHVGVITIDRPDRRNALDLGMLQALHNAISKADLRVLVVRGSEGHFCAGADLAGVEDAQFAVALKAVLDGLRGAPFPTIAAVEGAALGAGTQLAVACDLRTADPGSSFGIPAARLGLMVDQWTVQRLATVAGQGAARAMLLAADVLTGVDAHRLGLAQRLCTVDEALEWADEIAAKAPLTIAGHKLMLNHLDRTLKPDDAVSAAHAKAWASADFAEGLAAFRERRPPNFQGR